MLRICLAFVLALPSMIQAAERLQGQVKVIDADTWDVGGTRVRLHGIDAPELDQNCKDSHGADWACGAWATQVVRQQYQGKAAECVPLDRDRYDRIVARCGVGGGDVGQEIVLNGLAFAYRKYSGDYVAAESKAVSDQSGLHASYVQVPWVHRASGKTQPSPSCQIKGNISSKGARIYHIPGQRYYSKTRISAGKGERWFCSEAEARAAGWRASKR
ncbi:thermonuclease family protein [Rhodobacteraceae bacterium B1Z28]|uniref:Thermonuclease family protein n=1 Tax=Ruegeria haliotis TaxID=2747601 RepID=A0ABX2PK61_9RHOB|nr:thermonuclease family protein [Ruegeria haliotis]NVO54507.1 thermonuclease family protein [Ruegeria haliotis]